MNEIEGERIFLRHRAVGGLPLPCHLPSAQTLWKSRSDRATEKGRPLLDGDDADRFGRSEVQKLADRALLAGGAHRLADRGATSEQCRQTTEEEQNTGDRSRSVRSNAFRMHSLDLAATSRGVLGTLRYRRSSNGSVRPRWNARAVTPSPSPDSDRPAVIRPAKHSKRESWKLRETHQPLTDQEKRSPIVGKETVGRPMATAMLDARYPYGFHLDHFHCRLIGSRFLSTSRCGKELRVRPDRRHDEHARDSERQQV